MASKKEPLRVGLGFFAPYIMPCAVRMRSPLVHSSGCPVPGAFVDAFGGLAESLSQNYSVDFVRYTAAPVSAAFAIDELNANRIDLVMNPLGMNFDRAQAATFSSPVAFTRRSFLVNADVFAPTMDALFTNTVHQFGWPNWLSLFVAFLLLQFLLVVQMAVGGGAFRGSVSGAAHAWQSGDLQKHQKVPTLSLAGVRIALGAWHLAWFVLLNSLSALLTQNLVLTEHAPFTDLDSFSSAILVDDFRLVARHANTFYLQEARSPNATASFRHLNASLERRPAVLIPDVDALITSIERNEKLVYMSDSAETEIWAARSNCRLRSIEDPQGPITILGYAMRKGAGGQRLREHVDGAIPAVRAILGRDLSADGRSQCLVDQETASKAIGLRKLFVLFLFVFGADLIALFSIAIEICWRKTREISN